MPPATGRSSDRPTKTTSLHERAEADLAFVRAAVERSSHFTAVPGVGGVLMGFSALVAGHFAHRQPDSRSWLTVWCIEATVAVSIGVLFFVLKARRRNLPIAGGPSKRFFAALFPSLFAGAALSVALVLNGTYTLLPTVWMLSYGVAVLNAASTSVAPAVRMVGALFLIAGGLSIATPATLGDYWMALTFGVIHILFGALIALKHGG